MFSVDGRAIGAQFPPYIVAELSANHGGNLSNALEGIWLAKQSGASAVKIQSYTPDTITINSNKPDFLIREGIWAGRTLFELYEEAHTPFEWHHKMFEFAREHQITLFSSPFDESAVELLEELEAPAYKIASFELVDLPLIKRVALTNRPIFLSTGMASLSEITAAVDVSLEFGCGDLLLFHCISCYPALTEDSNLRNIEYLKKIFDVEIGLSDHTKSNVAAITSIGLGAVAIEKHVKPSETSTGPDASFSLTPLELKSLVHDCDSAWKALLNREFTRAPSEQESTAFRRSLYFMKDLKRGDIVRPDDIRSVRPGYGMKPKYYDAVLGHRVKRDVFRGDPVLVELFEDLKFDSI